MLVNVTKKRVEVNGKKYSNYFLQIGKKTVPIMIPTFGKPFDDFSNVQNRVLLDSVADEVKENE